ncbi:hypothetical protein [Pseudomonas sp. JG-B]|uniref:hypothetical protein n=1 Tax=Pseudomonas sp. JG-B TaxID=2603214 RepID=UPI00129EC6FA|nr:hypothetical protein [Pseudomonas sp. JG-B]MRK21536.1 hypothetical protein [Pseudomonas sp. JG-B]
MFTDSPYAVRRLAEAKRFPYTEPVTAYLTQAFITACCCIGVVHHHVRNDIWGRFADGHRIRTSDIQGVTREGGFWVLRTVNQSRYVVVTFHRHGGRQSLKAFLRILGQGFHPTPRHTQ